MPLTFAEKVKIICNRKNITIKDLAESLEQLAKILPTN